MNAINNCQAAVNNSTDRVYRHTIGRLESLLKAAVGTIAVAIQSTKLVLKGIVVVLSFGKLISPTTVVAEMDLLLCCCYKVGIATRDIFVGSGKYNSRPIRVFNYNTDTKTYGHTDKIIRYSPFILQTIAGEFKKVILGEHLKLTNSSTYEPFCFIHFHAKAMPFLL